MTDETPRRDTDDEPVTEPVPPATATPVAAAAPAPARARWRDRFPSRGPDGGGRRFPVLIAVAALLLGAVLGGGLVAIAAFAGHDRGDGPRHSEGRRGPDGEHRPGLPGVGRERGERGERGGPGGQGGPGQRGSRPERVPGDDRPGPAPSAATPSPAASS
jgi:hypothetical protein